MQKHLDLVTQTRARLIAAGVSGGKVVIDRDQPTNDTDFPLTCVHVMKDHAVADDAANAGVPDYTHETHLCIDSYSKATNGQDARAPLYTLGETVRNALLADPTWLALIEGVKAIETAYITPAEGRTSVSGVRLEFVIVHRTTWPPTITDNLAKVYTTLPHAGEESDQIEAPTTVPTA